VLLRSRESTAVDSNLAPGVNRLGIMLPYTPLHYLLLHDLRVTRGHTTILVLTSANAVPNQSSIVTTSIPVG
jgi:hydrogenase maturation protein HypF